MCVSNSDVFKTLERLRQPLWVFDTDHSRVCWSNAGGLAIWNAISLDELTARDMGTDMSPEVANRLRQYQSDFERDPTASFTELWTLYPNDTPRTLQIVYSAFRLDDGRMAMLCEALQDHQLDADGLRSAEALIHTPVMITLYDQNGRALYRNPAARASVRDMGERLDARFVHESAWRQTQAALTESGVANLTAFVRTSAGRRWHDLNARRCHDAVSGNWAWLVSEVDVTGLKKTEEHARFLAQHDPLTRLPNRSHVATGFQARLEQIRARGDQGAVIFIDLDHFKKVNDSLGHAAGDRLLVEIASRLRAVVREDDLVARLGGDEFLVLVSARDVVSHVRRLAARIADSLSRPMQLLGREARVTPTLGVSLFPHHGEDMETLMRHADLAVYQAKDRGRNTMVFFTAELNEAVQSRIALETDLRHALEEQQIEVFYQPRLRVQDNRVCGAEALARWRHPERGLVAPSEFIPLLEDSGHIRDLDLLVLGKAVQQQLAWSRLGHDLVVSVNLSASQFADPRLAQTLIDRVVEAGARPNRIELEITESILLGHDRSTVQTLTTLGQAGFRIAIDDFGTGYCNLAYLHRYRLDCLKIDRSFIGALDRARPITELIVSMAQLLQLDIVAEGVETDAQLEWLRARGCQEYQGFLFSAPLPASEFTALLDADPHRPLSVPPDARPQQPSLTR
ncbi:MAG: EAL domain-containing protein, partial [Gammaproteobacteria bacterium]|nr:EAL domain-containing protein [Gammaproteobacteria bacterium]